MVAPVLSGAAAKGARRFIRGATRIQDILGEHQDAVVAGHELASLSSGRPTTPSFTAAARRLLDGQADAARASREEFFDAWDKIRPQEVAAMAQDRRESQEPLSMLRTRRPASIVEDDA